jgi:hypothetical protein
MANLAHMRKVLYRHKWRDLQEWAAAVSELASLSEQEIGELARPPARKPAAADKNRRP